MQHIPSYPEIYAIGHRQIREIFSGPVVIEEKIDGSQISLSRIGGELNMRSKGKDIIIDAPEKMFNAAVETAKSLNLHDGWVYRGEYLCLSGDTRVKKVSGGRHDKYMTLETLYQLQNEPIKQSYISKGLRKRKPRASRRKTRWGKEGCPRLYSLDIGLDKVVKNRIVKVIHSGEKETLCITTRKGLSIKSTAEHKFWTPRGWTEARALSVGDCVGIIDDTVYRMTKRVFGYDHKAIKELWAMLKRTRSCEKCGADRGLQIHHIDQDFRNNKADNLQVVCVQCHGKIPRTLKPTAASYEFDSIQSIEPAGKIDCYDVEMEGGETLASFVAEGFIVHNCKPKHNTLAYSRVPKKHIILFDVMTAPEVYLTPAEKRVEADRLGLECVPCFHEGTATLTAGVAETLLQMDSILGGTKVEGFVVKNYALFTPDKKIAIAKYVSEAFKEKHQHEWKKTNPTQNDVVVHLIGELKTPARWQKAVQHLRDDGKLTETPQDIGALLKEIQADVLKEEAGEIKESLFKHFWPQIARGIIGGAPEWYKEQVGIVNLSTKQEGVSA